MRVTSRSHSRTHTYAGHTCLAQRLHVGVRRRVEHEPRVDARGHDDDEPLVELLVRRAVAEPAVPDADRVQPGE